MFVDLRDFTRLSEKRLPFDIVYVLNEFFGVVGAAITAHGGWIDKFLGDGLLAVFGQRDGVESGCRQALRTARDIDLALDRINAQLEAELGRPLAVGIGIDAGPLLLGRIGYGEAVDFTVIGNPVNVASRLEALTKEKDVQLILSREVAAQAGWEPAGGDDDARPRARRRRTDGGDRRRRADAICRRTSWRRPRRKRKSPRRGPRAFGVGARRCALSPCRRGRRRPRRRAP